ncbi:MAG TPA: nucleoside triphosphate pyrophosphohydrolase [Halanaerobiales bacterium]|nr:nucleoside triphosphate pyrophosphohydrolase [Halanaerobiales bacterium]
MESKNFESEFDKLLYVMDKLRGPEGCPWDRKQDFYSLKPYIIEEAYEVVEALEEKDMELLKEELGDLLLQVVFQAQIGKEAKIFDINDVISGITTKLIRRHPHVFGEEKIDTAQEVKKTWEEIKKKERTNNNEGSILDDVSKIQPSLNQAYEIQQKAAEVGFDWDEIKDVLLKVEEEIAELKEIIDKENKDRIEDEIGDLFFAVVNLSRFKDINPEIALLRTINKFKKRFNYIEDTVKDENKNIRQMSLEELDGYWNEAKEKNL